MDLVHMLKTSLQGTANIVDSIVIRSFRPLPSRTVRENSAKSMFLTRSRSASRSRSPEPYSSPATRVWVPRR